MTRLDALRNLGSIANQRVGDDLGMTILRPEAIATHRADPASPDDLFADALANQWRAIHDLETARLQMQAERRRIASILATFAASPISAASLQPILDLAAEMNKEPK